MSNQFKIVQNGIFKSIQGEGINAGRSAAFVRLALCNMRPKCYFCDENFEQYNVMSLEEIGKELLKIEPFDMVVVTGGEPTCQDIQTLFTYLKERYHFVSIETNGLINITTDFDWITCSPKTEKINLRRADEVKFIMDRNAEEMRKYIDNIRSQIDAKNILLQPKSNDEKMIVTCLEMIGNDPHLRLSLQQHKLINIR